MDCGGGNQDNLRECAIGSGEGPAYCSHTDDVGVRCFVNRFDANSDLRIVSASGELLGEDSVCPHN